MILVEYSDSEDEVSVTSVKTDGAGTFQTRKRKRDEQQEGNDGDEVAPLRVKSLPALPPSFASLYATSTRTGTTDDPSLHGGRQRQIPHIIGNWPCHVYLEWSPSPQIAGMIEALLSHYRNQQEKLRKDFVLQSFLHSDLEVQVPLHISLSAPLTLTTDTKEKFKTDLTTAIRAADIQPFTVQPTGLKWASNFDKTRHFLVLTLGRSGADQDPLRRLLDICNTIANNHCLPELYTSSDAVGVDTSSSPSMYNNQGTVRSCNMKSSSMDKFHISIGWSLTMPDAAFTMSLPPKVAETQILFSQVLIKIGSIVNMVSLKSP